MLVVYNIDFFLNSVDNMLKVIVGNLLFVRKAVAFIRFEIIEVVARVTSMR